MATNVYEGLFIFDSDLYAKGPDDVSGQVAAVIEQFGGEVLLSRLWDERKLAYPIKGHRRGTYWLAYFKMQDIAERSHIGRLGVGSGLLGSGSPGDDSRDPRLVDMLVEHAKAGHLHASERPEEVVGEGEAAADVFVPAEAGDKAE